MTLRDDNNMRGKRRVFWLLLLSQLLLTTMILAQSAQRVHVVKSGDTLYRIGQTYGLSVAQLYELNPSAREGIRPGQEIKLPTSAPQAPTSPSEPTYHAVQRGETLYSISRLYNTSVEALLRANPQLKSADQLVVGQVIKVPSGGEPSLQLPPPSTPPKSNPLAPQDGIVGLSAITVPAGATIYSLLRSTGWSEEEFFHYNPQVRDGLKAGMTILIPDMKIEKNLALSAQSRARTTVALALPFSSDKAGRRFSDYYSGVLLMLLEAKKQGINVDLHVVDCSDGALSNSLSKLKQLDHIDLLIGGVSEKSVLSLSELASEKGATYVIPFTSREYPDLKNRKNKVFQVNTPHSTLHRVAAEKFVKEYNGEHVLFVEHPSDNRDKGDFVRELKAQLQRAGRTFTEVNSTQFSTPEQVKAISLAHPRVVVVPTSGSKVAANNTLIPIANAVDSLGVSGVQAFGYPEWQTYMASLGQLFRKTEATFYTTFYVDPTSSAYKEFQRDFLYWYGHGVGSTYPKYSILGYDTANYFFTEMEKISMKERRGIQSSFLFSPSPSNPNYLTNLGIFFVRFRRDNSLPQS